MLLRILGKSISRRKARVAIAVVAVIMGASIAGALVTTSMNIQEKVGLEFRQYGANILLVPKTESIPVSIGDVDYGAVTEQRFVEESDLPKIKEINWAKNIMGYAPYLYSVVSVADQKTVLSGVWFDEIMKISPWWDVRGSWIEDRNDTECAIVGIRVADILNVGIGDELTLTHNDTVNLTSDSVEIVGIVETGSSEDNQIFVSLALAQSLTGLIGKVSTVQVSALCIGCPVETIAAEIEEKIPYVQAKSVKQMVRAEMEILGKIEELMLLVAVVALLASALGVMTTMTTSVVERTKEIGMMKAIGAENNKIASLFLLEALIIGLIGGVAGYVVGLGVAQFIGMSVFNSAISPKIEVLPLVLGISIGIATLASAIPVRRAISIEPAKVLRGE
ncbi:MAG: FtsX-like permease family protein [Thermoplasmata archaeon]|nr:MAG: FtsX-like permease family protein [Thermoplasmata archaeon]